MGKLLAGVLSALIITGVTASATRASARVANSATAASQIRSIAAAVVSNYAHYTGPYGPRYYNKGTWVSPDMGCWTCNLGPAVADAIIARRAPSRIPRVIATFDTALNTYQRPDGSFSNVGNSPGINTAFFVPELGEALIVLEGQLDASTVQRWKAAIVGGASFLIADGDVNFYANGNINLAYTEVMYLAWRVSGQRRFLDAYNASWNFVEAPPSPRWAGYGLVITKRAPASASHDAGGAGYLTEAGVNGPGFDPEYTMLQLDVASSLFAMSHDARALDLMNLLFDSELPRISSDFILNATDGSRHSLYTPFLSSGLTLLSRYGRSDLRSLLPAQVRQIRQSYTTYMLYTSRNYYMGLYRWLAPAMLDAERIRVVVPTGATTAYYHGPNSGSGAATRTARHRVRAVIGGVP